MKSARIYRFKFSAQTMATSASDVELEQFETATNFESGLLDGDEQSIGTEMGELPLVMMDEKEISAKIKKIRAKLKIVQAKKMIRLAKSKKLKAAIYRRHGITGSPEEKAQKLRVYKDGLGALE